VANQQNHDVLQRDDRQHGGGGVLTDLYELFGGHYESDKLNRGKSYLDTGNAPDTADFIDAVTVVPSN
jgi:hypothetical protein